MPRELLTETPAFKRFIKSTMDKAPADMSAPQSGAAAAGVTNNVYAPYSQLADRGAKNVKHTHPIYYVVFFGMLLVFVVYVISTIVGITTAQASEFSAQVRQVAQCERKTPNKIHGELRTKYGYNKYTNMNQIQYYRATSDLDDRLCEN